jgi:glyceraldehyde-3-phosphate dehydrogenase (NADP+)
MRAYYAGRWQDSGRPRPVENPFDRSVIDTVLDVPIEAVDDALEGARAGVKDRESLSNEQLGQILKRTAEAMRSHREELARAITKEQGKLLSDSLQEVEAVIHLLDVSAVDAFRLGSELIPLAKEAGVGDRFGFTVRRGYGVVVAITPYTYPLLLPAVIAIPALIAGNAPVLKPARSTPLSALRLVELLLEAGLPENVIACLTGPGPSLGKALCRDPRVDRIVFVGARETAMLVQRAAELKPVDLQWGGVGAVVVAEDANLDEAAGAIVERAFENAGQIAVASPWVLAAEPVYADLVEQLRSRVSALRCGDPMLARTRIGPLIDEPHAATVAAVVQGAVDRGAKCCCGGQQQGALVEATLLCDVAPEGMVFARQEFLGPVAGVSQIGEMKDAEQYLNSGRQLVASLFSSDTERAMHFARSLDVPNVHVNGIPSWRDGVLSDSRSPSRMGRHTIRDRAVAMTTYKDIVHHPQGPASSA